MSASAWSKVREEYAGHVDVSYEIRDEAGTLVAQVYRGGRAGYPWSWRAGREHGQSETLASAKSSCETVLANGGTWTRNT